MIVFVFGTTGELIKIAPVMRRLDQRGLAYLTVSTNQQVTQIPLFQADLGLRPTDVEVARGHHGRDLERRPDIPEWAVTVARRFTAGRPVLRRRLAASPGRHVLMVHGDTMTTVLGSLMGRPLGVPVAHLEAGMRSGDWRNPFPEELNRRAAGMIARIHYAPTEAEVANLKHARGAVVQLGGNTVRDSLDLVPDDSTLVAEALGPQAPDGRYAIVSLHRSELLSDRERLGSILELVASAKLEYPLFFIDHPVTVAAVRSFGLDSVLTGLVRIPRLRYTSFIALLRNSEFLLTDSGGCQEECFYLDIPCLIHRLVTERHEGLGQNVLISRYELEPVTQFLREPRRWRMGSRPVLSSPSDVVVADLIDRGVWGHD